MTLNGYGQWRNGYSRWINGYPHGAHNSTPKSPHLVATGTSNSANSPSGSSFTYGTLPTSSTWYYIAYASTLGTGNGRFVAVNSGGTASTAAAYSDDSGATWTSASMPNGNGWCDINWTASQFVAIASTGSGSQVAVSSDGISWTGGSMPSALLWEKARYGASTYVAVAFNGTASTGIATSSNGTTWSNATISTAETWRALCYGSGRGFCALSYNTSNYATSSGGSSWTQGSSAAINALDVAYSPTLDMYVCACDGSTIQYASGSGFPSLTWTALTVGSGTTWWGICWDSVNSQFVATGSSFSTGYFATSSNGTSWTTHATLLGTTYGIASNS